MINACYDGTIIAINSWTDQRIVHWEGLYGEKIINVEGTLTLPISFSKDKDVCNRNQMEFKAFFSLIIHFRMKHQFQNITSFHLKTNKTNQEF